MAQFKTKVPSLANVRSNVKKIFSEVVKDPDTLNEIGSTLVDQNKKAIRSGVDVGGSLLTKTRLPKLSPKWVERKEKLRSTNEASEYYRKGASNLTFTGQLVDSIKHKIEQSKGTVVIFISGKRKPYKNLKGRNEKDNPSNEEVAQDLKNKWGISIVGVTSAMRNIINKLVRKRIVEKLKKSRGL